MSGIRVLVGSDLQASPVLLETESFKVVREFQGKVPRPTRSLSRVTLRGMAKRVPNFIAWICPRKTRSDPEIPVGKPM